MSRRWQFDYMLPLALLYVLSLFALEAYNLATASHSVAMVIANAVMTVLVVRSRRNDR